MKTAPITPFRGGSIGSLACRRSFTVASFSAIYYMKRPELLEPLAALLNAGCAHRQITRLFQRKMLSMIDEFFEDIVYDHFEAFVDNQSNRFAMGSAVGASAWLVYDIRSVRYRGALRRSQ